MIGLAIADSNYDDSERNLIYKFLSNLGLDIEFGYFCEKKLTEYLNLQNELNTNILS